MKRLAPAARALALSALLLAAQAASAAELRIQNSNASGQGFNDPTPAAPVGLNFGTTKGAQAVILFQYAAAIWGATLKSQVPILIDAAFVTPAQDSDFTCTATEGLLGYTRAASYETGGGLPNPQAGYVVALANALVGRDLSPGSAHIKARFNAGIGTANCLAGLGWYYGLDNALAPGQGSLLATLLHEFAHGLGFSSFVDPHSGALNGPPSAYDFHVFDEAAGADWAGYQPSQRAPLLIGGSKLAFDGPNVAAGAARFLGNAPVLEVASGGATSEDGYLPGQFSGPIPDGGTFDIAPAVPLDACADLAGGSLAGRLGLVERGTCSFYDKSVRAAAAGASGVIIFDRDAGPLITMASPTDGGGPLSVPAVFISNLDGNSVLARLDGGTVSAGFGSSNHLSNTDATQARVLLYTPPTISPGSTLSHWNTQSFPKTLLMEPFIGANERLNLDLTPAALADLGWPIVNGLSVGMSKALDLTLADGAQATYLIAVLNRRTTAVDGVTLNLSLPAGAALVSAAGGCTAIPCTLGTVAAGEVRPVVVTVQPAKPTVFPFAVSAILSAPGTGSDDNLEATISVGKPTASSGGCATAGLPAALVACSMVLAGLLARRRRNSRSTQES